METKKENPIKPSGSLLIKIFAGYTILALLVIGIIAALWHEKKVFAEAEAEEELSELGFSVAQALRTRADTARVPRVPRRRDREGCLKNADIGSLFSGWSEIDYFRKIIPCTMTKHLKANTQSWENTWTRKNNVFINDENRP